MRIARYILIAASLVGLNGLASADVITDWNEKAVNADGNRRLLGIDGTGDVQPGDSPELGRRLKGLGL